jgi:hypothetical protein
MGERGRKRKGRREPKEGRGPEKGWAAILVLLPTVTAQEHNIVHSNS